MSRVDWLEVDGKRVREDDVKRVTEYRCDSCGEFVAEAVLLQMQLFTWQGRLAQLPQYHLHPECARKHLPFVIDEATRQGILL